MLNSVVSKWTLNEYFTILNHLLNHLLAIVLVVYEFSHYLLEHTQSLSIVCKVYKIAQDSITDIMEELIIEAYNSFLDKMSSIVTHTKLIDIFLETLYYELDLLI